MAVRAIGVRTDVSACLQSLCRVMGRLHSDKQIHLDLPDQELLFKGEEQDLQDNVTRILKSAFKPPLRYNQCNSASPMPI